MRPTVSRRRKEEAAPAEQSVAVVEDSHASRKLMCDWLQQAGYRTVEYTTGLDIMSEPHLALSAVCLDMVLDELSGMDVLEHLRKRDRELPVIVVTAKREIELAVEAMRAGAYDYLVKPFEQERFIHTVRRALRERDLAATVRRLEDQLASQQATALVGTSAPMRELSEQIRRVVESEVPVCIAGESGTGKELVARAIHAGGRRASGPFVAINCAAIPESLQESELFGHEKGAFTGAVATHKGRFEQAHGGTLFLDEVGEIRASTQASLLRTLQERTVRRVGGMAEVPVNVRIISATHRDLEEEVRAGRFRQDLYFRLMVYPIIVPPLRMRRDDIPLLVSHFLQKYGPEVGRKVARVSADALEALGQYGWPGNVRELENLVQRAMLASEGNEIRLDHLPPTLRGASKIASASGSGGAAAAAQGGAGAGDEGEVLPLREAERRAIARAMRAAGGSISTAARLLGIARTTLYRRLAELGLPGAEE